MVSKKAPNSIDKHVGARVRMRRMMLGMSQEKLGDALDLTFQQVQKYEKGTNRIGASRLSQIAAALQVGPAYFFDGAPGADTPRLELDPVQAMVTTRDGLRLAQVFARIASRAERDIVVRMAEALAERAATSVKRAA